ncbi:MAG TPA: AraC family transcriptional regulator [Caulobacteraceae bacterium]
MEALSRSAALTGYADLARSAGLDPHRILEAAGVPRLALDDPDLMIPARAVGQILEASAQRSGMEDFGLRLAEKRRLSNLGVVALIAREQPSVRHAIGVMAQYIWIQSDALSLVVEETGEVALLRTVIAPAAGPPSRQATELVVGVLCRTLATLLGPGWRPQLVCFCHAPPRGPSAHLRVCGAEVAFDQDFDGVVCARSDLDAAIPTADPAMALQVARYAQKTARSRPRQPEEQIRELVLLLLPTGQATVERVANHLGVDRRTVARQLAARGVSFSDLRDDVRVDRASAYLDAGERSLTAIADLLGFSALSAFSRWHVQRFGESPSARRARRAAAT